ncbi:MAG: acetyltransferase [Gammaproteobacteria bacterium]
MKKELVIVGDSAFAEIAYEYFTHDSDYTVAGFAVEAGYLKSDSLFGLPIVPFETVQERFHPDSHDLFVATVYTQLNRLRARLCREAKLKGYSLASYVSSKAFVWHNVKMGEHCFIFEDNTVQPFVELGDDVILWSGNHIGHHSKIGSHCFLSSHVVVSGFVEVGPFCFLGVNTTIANNLTIGPDCWVEPAAIVTKGLDAGTFLRGTKSEAAKVSTYRYFKVEPD